MNYPELGWFYEKLGVFDESWPAGKSTKLSQGTILNHPCFIDGCPIINHPFPNMGVSKVKGVPPMIIDSDFP